ncbi:enoyl-CoA hydratase [Tessaracoccus oleiagri]|uniref:Enoyl-CoA hydratase domain-containing protein 3, mitochondrial n=1 Tax=Tessaracoccus oleiagri TaxID=686624 RepID=A0A1G9L670_9ACTN|nr:enoyl-CoA hydratase [Tessaracoccus oleiagri]SDL57442.1 short chain enoyl-CoA hydratase [Tessaracoccus oleiagri]
MAEALVHLEVEDTVAVVTLNNPAKRGALSMDAMKGLIESFRQVAERRDVHAAVLRSEGTVFSAGHDLGEVRNADHDQLRRIFGTCAELMQLIQRIPQPVIAQVQGLATAAGCQLVATCDLAVAAETAGFATPGVRIGLFCSTPMVALTRAVDRKTAMKMLLTGEPIGAAEARAQGLVSHVVAPEELTEATMAVARRVAGFSSATVSVGKRAFYEQAELSTAEAYAHMVEVMAANALAPDAKEGIGAFLDKREPVWQHRS